MEASTDEQLLENAGVSLQEQEILMKLGINLQLQIELLGIFQQLPSKSISISYKEGHLRTTSFLNFINDYSIVNKSFADYRIIRAFKNALIKIKKENSDNDHIVALMLSPENVLA